MENCNLLWETPSKGMKFILLLLFFCYPLLTLLFSSLPLSSFLFSALPSVSSLRFAALLFPSLFYSSLSLFSLLIQFACRDSQQLQLTLDSANSSIYVEFTPCRNTSFMQITPQKSMSPIYSQSSVTRTKKKTNTNLSL